MNSNRVWNRPSRVLRNQLDEFDLTGRPFTRNSKILIKNLLLCKDREKKPFARTVICLKMRREVSRLLSSGSKYSFGRAFVGWFRGKSAIFLRFYFLLVVPAARSIDPINSSDSLFNCHTSDAVTFSTARWRAAFHDQRVIYFRNCWNQLIRFFSHFLSLSGNRNRDKKKNCYKLGRS